VTQPNLHDAAHMARERATLLRERTEQVLAAAEATLAQVRQPDRADAVDATPSEISRLVAEIAGLRRAMDTRAVVEQAKGVLIARTGCSPNAAFELLVRQSQFENRKLHDVAVALVAANVKARSGV
jgi:hypothetical protein